MVNSQAGRFLRLIGILTFLAALLVVGALVVIPAVGTFVLSLKDYSSPAMGILGSPFVGARNYQTLLQAYGYGLSLLRSLQFAGLSSLVLLAMGAVAGYALRVLSPVPWLRHALCTLLLVPLLVPGELWAQAFFAIFPSQAVQSLATLAFWCGIKYVGLATLLATAALSHGNRSGTIPLLSAGVVALGLFALLGLQDYTFLRLMSSLSAMRNSLDLFVYRQGLEQSRYSIACAVTMNAIALRAVLLALVAFPVASLVKRLFPPNVVAAETTTKDRALSLLASAAVALAIAVALAATALGTTAGAMIGKYMAIYPVYIALALVGSAFNTVLCWCLARPVVTAKPAARRGVTTALLLLTALSSAPISIGEYMQFRVLGMVNTLFPVLLSGLGSPMGIWPLVFAARALGVQTNEQWFRRMWRPALALMAINVALRMNDTVPSMLYLSSVNLRHPLGLLSAIADRQATIGAGDLPLAAAIALIALLTMAVPVALLLLVRTVFTEKETVGLALP